MTQFDKCLELLFEDEGGFSNHPRDNGGATKYGITIGTLGNWLGREATIEDVRALTQATAREIYHANYWRTCKCDELPQGIDYIVFDLAVNSGVGTAGRLLQESINGCKSSVNPKGVVVDGVIGPVTAKTAHKPYIHDLLGVLVNTRDEYYRSLDDFDVFGQGWLARLERVRMHASAMT